MPSGNVRHSWHNWARREYTGEKRGGWGGWGGGSGAASHVWLGKYNKTRLLGTLAYTGPLLRRFRG